MLCFVYLFQENQIKIKLTTSDLIAARKKVFLETNMNDRKMYDHVQDDFKNVSCICSVNSFFTVM